MAKKPPKSALTFLATAWEFYRKQPVLNQVVLWLGIVPVALLNSLPLAMERSESSAALALDISLFILVMFLTTWGTAAILLIGRRMIQNRAGRSRSSLRPVLQDSAPWVLPLLLTSILQFCFTFYRSLLFFVPAAIVMATPAFCLPADGECGMNWPALLLLTPLLIPAFVYFVRTSFFGIAIFTENVRYHAALKRSRALTKGKFWHVLGTLVLLSLLLIGIPTVLTFAIDTALSKSYPASQVIGITLAVAINEFGLLLFSLATIAMYGHLKGGKSREVVAPEIEPG